MLDFIFFLLRIILTYLVIDVVYHRLRTIINGTSQQYLGVGTDLVLRSGELDAFLRSISRQQSLTGSPMRATTLAISCIGILIALLLASRCEFILLRLMGYEKR